MCLTQTKPFSKKTCPIHSGMPQISYRKVPEMFLEHRCQSVQGAILRIDPGRVRRHHRCDRGAIRVERQSNHFPEGWARRYERRRGVREDGVARMREIRVGLGGGGGCTHHHSCP